MTATSDGKTKTGLSINLSNLQPKPGLRYDLRGKKGEIPTSPPPNPDVRPEEKKKLLLAFCKSADSAAITEAFDLLTSRALLPTPATNQDDDLPVTAPALWENRTTGRKVSPAEFIRAHYAPWLGQGLTRAHIGQIDKKLYEAYAQQIKRNPDEAIHDLPSEERVKVDDPAQALERAREKARERKKKHLLSRNVLLN